MSLIALVLWITTAGIGLYLLSIGLLEYDKDFQYVTATRLPPAVLTTHVLLAGGGLLAWIGYLILDQDRLAWTALAAVLLAAMLGTTMAIRWVGVYRAARASRRRHAELAEARLTLVGAAGGTPPPPHPPEPGAPAADVPPPLRNR